MKTPNPPFPGKLSQVDWCNLHHLKHSGALLIFGVGESVKLGQHFSCISNTVGLF